MVRCDSVRHFLHLAFAGIRRRIRTMSPSVHLCTNQSTGRLSKQTHLFQFFSHGTATEIELDDDSTFARGGTFNHQSAYVRRSECKSRAEARYRDCSSRWCYRAD